MTLRGSRLSAHRLAAVAASALVAVTPLAGCSDDEPTASSTPAASPSATPTSSAPRPSTSAPSASPTASTPSAAGPTGSAAPTPDNEACPASKVKGPNTSGMSPKAATKAKAISSAARACDAKKLVSLARADATGLQADLPAAEVFTDETPQTFLALAALLTLPPAPGIEGTVQPRVFSAEYARDDAAWNEVVKAGLLDKQGAAEMRRENGGYNGYRIGLTEDGTWTFFTTDG